MVLDEVHGYIGSQAAEIALLLRRVRAAFGVNPDQVQLMATSATIGEGESVKRNLQCFIADLAGHNESCVRVIEGRTVKSELPLTGDDTPLEPTVLSELDPTQLWKILAPHPRIQKLKQRELQPILTIRHKKTGADISTSTCFKLGIASGKSSSNLPSDLSAKLGILL